MSSRTMSGRTQSFGIQQKAIRFRIMASAGSWTTPVIVGGRGASASIAGAGIADGVTSVVRNSAGKFTVTLDDSYAKLETFQVSYQGSGDAEDIVAQAGVVSNLATSASTPVTVVVKTKTGGANTDPGTTDVNTSINVDLVFEDSGA